MSGEDDNRRPEGVPGVISVEPPVPPEDPEAVALLHSVGAHAQAVAVSCGVLGVIRIEAADAP